MFINNFDPVAFNFFTLEIRWYSLSYIFGIIIAWLVGWILGWLFAWLTGCLEGWLAGWKKWERRKKEAKEHQHLHPYILKKNALTPDRTKAVMLFLILSCFKLAVFVPPTVSDLVALADQRVRYMISRCLVFLCHGTRQNVRKLLIGINRNLSASIGLYELKLQLARFCIFWWLYGGIESSRPQIRILRKISPIWSNSQVANRKTSLKNLKLICFNLFCFIRSWG